MEQSFGALVLLLTNFPSPLFHSLFLFPHHSSNKQHYKLQHKSLAEQQFGLAATSKSLLQPPHVREVALGVRGCR